MCSEINESSEMSGVKEKTFDEKYSGLLQDLREEDIIFTENDEESVTTTDEPAVMAIVLAEHILFDKDDGFKLLKRGVKDYPGLRPHFIGAYKDSGFNMPPNVKKVLSMGLLNKFKAK